MKFRASHFFDLMMLTEDTLDVFVGIDLKTLIKDADSYLAHTPDETLVEHLTLVMDYVSALVKEHALESVIEQLIEGCLPECSEEEQENLRAFLKELFFASIVYHDFGKVNENFQKEKMEREEVASNPSNGISTEHSVLSAYIFIVHYSEQIGAFSSKKLHGFLSRAVFAFALPILRHHGSCLPDLLDDNPMGRFDLELCEKLAPYLDVFTKKFSKGTGQRPSLALKILREEALNKKGQMLSILPSKDPFAFFALLKLNYSLLTASDYYATAEYYSKERIGDFGVFSGEQKNGIASALREHPDKDYNRRALEETETIIGQPLEELSQKDNENLNKLRLRMASEAVANVRENIDNRLFYLEAPTGGGKTNTSLLVAGELMRLCPEVNKIVYVFPFTTLATQTKKVVQETYGLDEGYVAELHGRAPMPEKPEVDGEYGDDRKHYIHYQFANYPFALMTHIRFFDVLKGNGKELNYLLHRLANSVVVLDEIQGYTPLLWDKVIYLLKKYARYFNIRFVVMSATLPKVDHLVDTGDSFVHCIKKPIERFFQNPNFSGRVAFDLSMLGNEEWNRPSSDEEKADYLQRLARLVHEKSEAFAEQHHQGQKVHAVIEFIFKRTASEFRKIANEVFPDYQVLEISGSILEPRRKEVINLLKRQGKTDAGKVLLVTTQVVEAGVDIDMDLGFKDVSIIDSEEQLAGRINRNVKKAGCTLYLFDLDKAGVIYGKDFRYQEQAREGAKLWEAYQSTLASKDFDKWYNGVMKRLDQSNKAEGKQSLPEYEEFISSLSFARIDQEFRLIDQQNVTVFVPLQMPKEIQAEEGDMEPVFKDSELRFLEKNGVDVSGSEVCGIEVFELYKSLVQDRMNSARFIDLKQMQSILSKYSFSVFANSKDVDHLRGKGNEEVYGYLYAVHHDFYTFENGVDGEVLKDTDFF